MLNFMLPIQQLTEKVKQKYKVAFFKRIVIQTLIIVFLIGNTKIVILFKFVVNAFLYQLSSLFYETNNQFQILKKICINGYKYFIIQNLKDSFRKIELFKYNHKNDFLREHLGTYRKFYWYFCLIKRCNTTSVIYNHEFLTSYELKILKTLCFLKKTKNKYINLFFLLKNPKFLFINYKILISKLNNLKFSIYKITLNQVKFKWFKELAIRLHNGNFQFIKNLKSDNFYNYNLLKLSNLKNEIVYQSTLMVLELIFESTFLDTSYGYKPTKGCHSALKHIKWNWGNVSCILKFNIQSHLSNFNFNRLINILKLKIKDSLFINLIKRLFKTNLKNIKTKYLPILYNLYLHTFDLEIIKIQKKLDNIKKPYYKLFNKKKLRILNILKYGIILTHKNQTILNKLNLNKNKLCNKSKINLLYIRYSNYFLLGLKYYNENINKIEKRITTFLNSNLKLLVLKKQFINIRLNKISFLSFEIFFKPCRTYTKRLKTKYKKKQFEKIAFSNRKNWKFRKNYIIIKTSLKNFKTFLIKNKLMSKTNKPKAIKWLLSYSNKLIVKWFYTLAIKILNFYCCCDNFYKIKTYVDYIIRYSALYTLALKNKTTFSNILNRWSRDILIKDKKNINLLAKFINKTDIKNQKKQFLNYIDYETINDVV